MSNASWWASKLSGQAAEPAAPTYVPHPNVARPMPQPNIQQIRALPAHLMPNAGPQHDERVTKENFHAQAKHWKGGEATKTQTTPCPNCGSTFFMSPSNIGDGATVPGRQNTARCMECGYVEGRGVQGPG